MNSLEEIRRNYDAWLRWEAAMHGGTGAAIIQDSDAHKEFGKWLVDGFPDLLDRMGQLEEQLAAAASQLESFAGCQACKSAIDAETCSDKSCMYGEKWAWRGHTSETGDAT